MTADQNANRTTGETEGIDQEPTDVGGTQLEHEERKRYDRIDRVIDKADSDASDDHRDAQRDP